MTEKSIVLVSGSPSKTSRSARLLEEVGAQVERAGFVLRAFSLASFEPRELLNPTTETPNVRALVEAARAASALVVSTPVYKGTFSGVSKVILDLIPPDALTGRVGLAIATARIPEQLPETARALAGIFGFFKLGRIVEALTFTDEELKVEPNAPLPAAVARRVDATSRALLGALQESV